MPFNFIARKFVFLPFSFDVYDMGMSGALDLNDKKKELMASQMEWNQFNLIDAMIIFQGEKCNSGKIYERKLYWRIVAFSDAFHELTYLALFSCRRIFVYFASLFREESSSLSRCQLHLLFGSLITHPQMDPIVPRKVLLTPIFQSQRASSEMHVPTENKCMTRKWFSVK